MVRGRGRSKGIKRVVAERTDKEARWKIVFSKMR